MEQLKEFNSASFHKQSVESERPVRVRGVLASKNFQETGKRLESLFVETDIPKGQFEDWVKTELGMTEAQIKV